MRHINVNSHIRLPQLVMAALCATAVAVRLPYPAVATAEPNDGAWDVIAFDDCLKKYNPGQAGSEEEMEARIKWCCLDTGGVWKDNGTCVAPPPDPAPAGSQHDTSDIGTETVTKSPPPPIHVPSDIGTETFTPAATPTPPPTPATTQAPPVNPCLVPQEPICRN